MWREIVCIMSGSLDLQVEVRKEFLIQSQEAYLIAQKTHRAATSGEGSLMFARSIPRSHSA